MDHAGPGGLPDGQHVGGPPLRPLGRGDRVDHVVPGARRRALTELTALWLVTLPLISLVVFAQGAGLPEWTLAAVPFLFIYAPVVLCNWRKVDSYEYRIAIPAFSDAPAYREGAWEALKVIAVITIPFLVGYHVYQNVLGAIQLDCGRVRTVQQALDLGGRVLAGECGVPSVGAAFDTVMPRWRVPENAALLIPYHLFFVAIPEEFFYRGYFQTRLNEVFPRKFLIFGVPVGWGLVIASLFFAFGHSLVVVRWWHFATFFPGLLFGWLREKTGQPLAGALLHAWANVTVTCLDTFYGVI